MIHKVIKIKGEKTNFSKIGIIVIS